MAQSTRVNDKQKQELNSGAVGFRLREAALILSVALAAYLLLSLWSYQPTDPGWSTTGTDDIIANSGGIVGAWLADALLYGFGFPAYLSPLMIGFSGWLLFSWGKRADTEDALHFWVLKMVGLLMALAAASGLSTLSLSDYAALLPLGAGGVLGEVVGHGFESVFGASGTSLLLLAVLLTGVTLFTGLSWLMVIDKLGAMAMIVAIHVARWVREIKEELEAKRTRQKREETFHQEKEKLQHKAKVRIEPVLEKKEPSKREEKEKQVPLFETPDAPGMPALALLDMAQPSKQAYSEDVLQAMSRQVELKLKDFGVDVQVVEVQPGPVVTRFELQPAPGIKVSRISGLAKDLARALSISSVRIVEVIPGKPVVGLEIPNESREIVRLREILACDEYENSKSLLMMALGKDIAGRPVVANLEKMPHLLVAGTTGSGKSVAVNAMILSLLYKATPEDVRMIMVDPKMLELSVYEDIPHLLAPVVTDMKEAANALRWCVAEMERRYPLMAALGVRNIAGYNKKVREAIERGEPIKDPTIEVEPGEVGPTLEPLPFIVVIIDELADMMMVVGKQVEELIARLAQKARASGIHLILATQRPSVDVITGLIKANIPTRMAFQVSSRIDSRTILDQMGAEQLLGQGDMLYLPPGSGLPERVHGAFVDDHEVHNVVEHLKKNSQPNYLEEITQDQSSDDGDGGIGDPSDAESDPLYDQAVQIVVESRRASVSGIQRRLKIGYNRAARIVEAMEAAGVVSAMQGNGSREVLAPPPRD
ncbi:MULTISPECIES: DNA translocase FtsK [unclassified Methylophaga]|uniref:DNA translocase FtsK n=1 Tax=unclassified Methylophaga TaxID=2629249 RepID=UPI000C47F266|nr:DNA translocase FtsK [Methylophaga sp. UBA678]MAX51964.1 cell division protein FtsK [Methylophaga sp.]